MARWDVPRSRRGTGCPTGTLHSRCPVSTELWENRDAWHSARVHVCTGEAQLNDRGRWAAERPCFPCEPELASNAERWQWPCKYHDGPGNPAVSFLIYVTSLGQPTIYADSDDLGGKKKLFSFCPSSLFSKPKVRDLVEWAGIKK